MPPLKSAKIFLLLMLEIAMVCRLHSVIVMAFLFVCLFVHKCNYYKQLSRCTIIKST
jgi:hypothetical protein